MSRPPRPPTAASDSADRFTATDFRGTSEELHVPAWMADHMAELTARHGTVRLFRNEGHFALYGFVGGRRFQPDFALFLERGEAGEAQTLQLFIEPKGAHLADQGWKQDFLQEIAATATLPNWEGRRFRVHCLPFFRQADRAAFGEAMRAVVAV